MKVEGNFKTCNLEEDEDMLCSEIKPMKIEFCPYCNIIYDREGETSPLNFIFKIVKEIS